MAERTAIGGRGWELGPADGDPERFGQTAGLQASAWHASNCNNITEMNMTTIAVNAETDERPTPNGFTALSSCKSCQRPLHSG